MTQFRALNSCVDGSLAFWTNWSEWFNDSLTSIMNQCWLNKWLTHKESDLSLCVTTWRKSFAFPLKARVGSDLIYFQIWLGHPMVLNPLMLKPMSYNISARPLIDAQCGVHMSPGKRNGFMTVYCNIIFYIVVVRWNVLAFFWSWAENRYTGKMLRCLLWVDLYFLQTDLIPLLNEAIWGY